MFRSSLKRGPLKIALDLDETLVETSDPAFRTINSILGTDYSYSLSYNDELIERLPSDHRRLVFEVFNDYCTMCFADPCDGAQEAVEMLREDGHSLTVVTRRPQSLAIGTREMVKRLFGFMPVVMTEGGSKLPFLLKEKIDLLVDDHPVETVDAIGAKIPTFVICNFRTPYSDKEYAQPSMKVESLLEAARFLRRREER